MLHASSLHLVFVAVQLSIDSVNREAQHGRLSVMVGNRTEGAMGWLFIGLGSTMLLLATMGRIHPRFARRRRVLTILVASLSLASISVSVVVATHTVITSSDMRWQPSPFNGWKVYLSSPRHINSGGRGECGWEENINGRHFNYNATHTTYGAGGMLKRGYITTVSGNARDDGGWKNVNSANNWGANVYIVTHTNGDNGCPDSAQYLLVMFVDGNWGSTDLRSQLLAKMDPVLPGGQNTWSCIGGPGGQLAYECRDANAPHRVYVEAFFHDNQPSVDLFQTAGWPENNTWRYGWAVDVHLGYP